MQRTVCRWAALAAAALAGYTAGAWNHGTAHAAKDPSRELIVADRAFDAATAQRGVDGWLSWFAPDAIMMPAGRKMVVGQTAIQEYTSKAFAAPGFSMRWEPVDAGAADGLGYTYGVFKTTRPGAGGNPVIAYGKYVTIWRKQSDRSWKVALDIGNASPPPEPAPESKP
jgi:ketosteroid isomerase-like protein